MGQPPVLKFLHSWLTSTRSTNFSRRIKPTAGTAKRTLRKFKFVHNSFPSCSRHYRNNLPGQQERFFQSARTPKSQTNRSGENRIQGKARALYRQSFSSTGLFDPTIFHVGLSAKCRSDRIIGKSSEPRDKIYGDGWQRQIR